MSQVLKTGLTIGALCVAWTFVMGFTGWYKDPSLAVPLFLVPVILIEVVLLVAGLRRTAASQGYGRQVLTGTLMALVAAVVIVAGSLVFTTVVFPTYFQDLRTAHEQLLREAGKSAQEIQAELLAAEAANPQTPLANALSGAIGTVATGLLTSLIAAAFLRRKPGVRS
jgi:hypothetical protein